MPTLRCDDSSGMVDVVVVWVWVWGRCFGSRVFSGRSGWPHFCCWGSEVGRVFLRVVLSKSDTLAETNIAPENRLSREEMNLSTIEFQGLH